MLPSIVLIKRQIHDITNSGNLKVCESSAMALLDSVEKWFTCFLSEEEIDGVQTVMIAELKKKMKFFQNKLCNDLRSLDTFYYLRRLFVQLNTGLPSSATVERLFSLGGRVLTPMRTQLSDQRYDSLVFLTANANLT
ncbi:Uncharacterized protein APZ42_025072 [Daphnia magna]|uniref:HAT C-terminal dimerisation domain-containing protein n=1 Tax=Daphnia magna TaxID=35525 RepID=A0A164THV1_9CRUS|nr:Uncharacterized protein APZ42_025072 [Daphnia magna]